MRVESNNKNTSVSWLSSVSGKALTFLFLACMDIETSYFHFSPILESDERCNLNKPFTID